MPRPMATPITLTLTLSHRGRWDTICYALPPCRPGHTPAFASLRVPFRFSKGDGGGGTFRPLKRPPAQE